MADAYEVRPIGVVESPLADPGNAPKQGFEGAPEAWIVLDPAVAGTPVVDLKPVLAGGR